MLLMSVAEQKLLLDADWVREVLAFEGLTAVAAVPPWFAGLVVVRGELIAVIDLAQLWGRCAASLNTISRLVIVGGEQAEFALLAEAAEELRMIDEGRLEALPPGFETCGFMRGATPDGAVILAGKALLEDRRIFA